MKRCTILTVILIVLSAVLCFAGDLNGRWEGSMNTPNGDFPIVFHFKVDGAKLTGSVEADVGNVEITDGKVDGDKFSFKTHLNDSEITHEGTLSGDTIQLNIEGPWGKSSVTLKRAQEKPAAKQP
jgi:hypothetical protein